MAVEGRNNVDYIPKCIGQKIENLWIVILRGPQEGSQPCTVVIAGRRV